MWKEREREGERGNGTETTGQRQRDRDLSKRTADEQMIAHCKFTEVI